LKNWKDVQYRIREEGMDYCFEHYSSWLEIEDENFHKLKKDYLDISRKLKNLINNKVIEIEEKIFEEEN
jgi:hypothetical protein